MLDNDLLAEDEKRRIEERLETYREDMTGEYLYAVVPRTSANYIQAGEDLGYFESFEDFVATMAYLFYSSLKKSKQEEFEEHLQAIEYTDVVGRLEEEEAKKDKN